MNNLAEITTTATNQAPIVPINLEAEQLLLGTLLFDNEQLTKIADTIIADDFYHPLHQELFNQINKFYQRSIIATPVTLKNLFESNEALKEHGGINYLSDLATQGASCFNIVDHAKTVRDLALRRQLMSLGRKVVTAANNFDEHDQAQDLIEQTELQLYNLASVSSLERDYYNLGQTLNMAIERANFAHQNQDHITGLSTGFNDINNYLTGWQNGDLVILAARPSMGKTSLALNFAVNACKFLKEHKQQYCAANNQDPKTAKDPSVGFFSLEMSAEQLSLRILSTESSVNSNRIRNGELSDSDFEKIVAANQELQAYNMLIDDTPALTIAALKTRARRMKRQHNLAILFVDYLQLLRGVGNNRDGNRVQEISEITQGLKAIAKELNIPVIALSQLS
ncbi:MAG: DnaB-like helicase C-terminal domain-containing protein, partial [Pseudomonadota bacterium]